MSLGAVVAMHRAGVLEWARLLSRMLVLRETVLRLPEQEAGALKARKSCERHGILGNSTLDRIDRADLESGIPIVYLEAEI